VSNFLSRNAIQPSGALTAVYTAGQGRAIGFDEFVDVRTDQPGTCIAGNTHTLITGTLHI
jgi:hypothetical protein